MAQTIDRKWETVGINKNHGTNHYISFGGMLRDVREHRNLNQIDVAEALGWKGASSRVSVIETSQHDTSREFIEQLVDIFNLDPYKRTELLLAGRFLSSEEDIQQTETDLKPSLSPILPQQIMDFGGRLIIWNQVTEELFGIQKKIPELTEERPHILELMFDPRWGLKQRLQSNWLETTQLETEALHMDALYFGLDGVRWYELLKIRLGSMEGFRNIWNDVLEMTRANLINKHPLIGAERRHKFFADPGLDQPLKTFRVIHTPLITDARLKVVTYIPELAAKDS